MENGKSAGNLPEIPRKEDAVLVKKPENRYNMKQTDQQGRKAR